MPHQRPQQDAGLPDGGLFTPDQLQAVDDAPLFQGPTPAHSVIEVKGTNEKRDDILKTEQVEHYWNHSKQLLVTNLSDFAVVGSDAAGMGIRETAGEITDNRSQFVPHLIDTWFDPGQYDVLRG